jgi:acyl dehydratase
MFFDDIEIGSTIRVGSYRVTAEEIVEFGRRWDPLPTHTDEQAAKASPFGGLIAAGAHTVAIRTLLLHKLPTREAVIATGQWDEVRFHQPVRPGDELWLEVTWTGKRESTSKPDRGIVTAEMRMLNQKDEVVLSQRNTIFMRRRQHA